MSGANQHSESRVILRHLSLKIVPQWCCPVAVAPKSLSHPGAHPAPTRRGRRVRSIRWAPSGWLWTSKRVARGKEAMPRRAQTPSRKSSRRFRETEKPGRRGDETKGLSNVEYRDLFADHPNRLGLPSGVIIEGRLETTCHFICWVSVECQHKRHLTSAPMISMDSMFFFKNYHILLSLASDGLRRWYAGHTGPYIHRERTHAHSHQ